MSDAPLPVIAIIGRPNVGKSALFNRLMHRRQSLVDATPGLTRDRLYGDLVWRGRTFRIVDTGGLQFSSPDRIQEGIASQVARAMEEATACVLVFDGREGLIPMDRKVADWSRHWGKPVLPLVNKVDGDLQEDVAFEFAQLGMGTPHTISGLHGLGIGELLDALVDLLPPSEGPPEELEPAVRIAIVGRPNVGKSSLLNRILNEERVLVDAQAGTTRDPVETEFRYKGKRFLWIDTAGVRARKTLQNKMEAVARLKSLEVLTGSDVCVGVLEASTGILRDDLRLLDQAVSAGKPLCLAINKWDLMPRSTDQKQAAAVLARRAPFLRFAPVVCISAKTGFQVLKLVEQAAGLAALSKKRLTTAETQNILELLRVDPKAPPGIRHAHMIRLSQVGGVPPAFHLMARTSGRFGPNDAGYVEKVIREQGGFHGAPVRVRFLVKRR